MSDLIKTLKSSSTGDDVYPNIKEDNIPSGAVTSAKIGTSAVITGKINDGAVTTNKVSDGAITYEKLALALKNLIDGKASNYDLSLVQSALNTHVANTSNPHSVTKSQVGLGNVDNTSDANKPVSTATQTALDLKADKSTTYTKTEVDTALSGKASLSGGNTFIGNQTFNNDIELENEGNITFTDSGYGVDNLDELFGNIQSSINAKQTKLYQHNFMVGGTYDSDQHSISIGMSIITSKSTQLTYTEIKNYIENNTIFSTYIGVEVSGSIGTNNYFGLKKYGTYLQLLYKDGEYDFSSDDINWNELVFSSLQDYTITAL